jgi:ribonuclease BN (tRNA processing enzyme)
MSFSFRSICSSSDGNCLLLKAKNVNLLFDCGLSSMKRTRQMLSDHFTLNEKLDAVVLSHAHTDHISYYPLRVLEELDCSVMMHQDCIYQLHEKHFNGYGFKNLNLKSFDNNGFTLKRANIKPIPLSHHPSLPTFGFVITCRGKKAVIATDFNRGDDVLEHLIDADFIFIESNHDPELLRRYYNRNSTFHMSNPQTADLLCQARIKSKKPPQVVMLGHISDQRNRPAIAIEETKKAFSSKGVKIDFELCTAPLKKPGQEITISG